VGIANETSSVVRKFPESAEVEPDGTVLYRQRYVGAFTQALRLRSFPFDRQAFYIQLVAIRYRPDEVMFVPDQNWINNGLKQGAGIAPSITLPDWTIEKWDTKPVTYALAPGFDYSGYAFEFTASRNVQHYILKVILPLRFNRHDVVGWLLDRSDPFRLANQRRGYVDANTDRLSLRRGHAIATAPIHDPSRRFLSD
jgi:hypothetical protein